MSAHLRYLYGAGWLDPGLKSGAFSSGGQAKFTHLTTGPGYGFDLEEIYFYDLFNCDEAYCR